MKNKKNEKNKNFSVNYRFTKHTKKGNGIQMVYTLEYFCCGGGHVMVTVYHGLMKYGKITKSRLKNTLIDGGYKLAHNLYNSVSHETFEEIEVHTNVI